MNADCRQGRRTEKEGGKGEEWGMKKDMREMEENGLGVEKGLQDLNTGEGKEGRRIGRTEGEGGQRKTSAEERVGLVEKGFWREKVEWV